MASVLTAIAGLMNRDGGVVIIGIEDRTNRVIGIEKDISLSTPNKDSDQFITWLENQIISAIGSVKLGLTDIRCESVKEKMVCRIDVEKSISSLVPISSKKYGFEIDTFFVRHSKSTRKLTPSEAIEYMSQKTEKNRLHH